ncbi:MAG: hypothetical protein O2967_22755 [Proteobacteria bacterium]|nr:hypothetical protein [Pseudomonadota bacterium]
MREFATLTPAQIAEARQRFAANQLADFITTAAVGDASARIPISRLYGIANDPGAGMPADVAAAMLQQPALRAAYRNLLARAADYQVPEAMAASTEALPVRTGGGCRIRFLPSQAEANQVYLIVELDDPAAPPPGALVFCDQENFCAAMELTGWRNGVTQRIIEMDSDILRLARDPKSIAYLR